jgi:DNA-binding transcriptional MerR regulator
MHNFNYWLQDRDVKYFKEFYLLKGFVFNEYGEPEEVSKPTTDPSGRYYLVPRVGAEPNRDGAFHPNDYIKIRVNAPNAGALVMQAQDAWREYNAKKTAQKAKSAPQNTNPSFASTSPRGLFPRGTGHEVSPERQEAHFRRREYARMLGLDELKASKGNFDEMINNAIAKDAIENGNPSFKTLTGATKNTFDYKRILVNTHGKDWLKWDKVIKNIWDASGEEILDIRAGKYDIKPTETEPELPPTAIKQTYAEPTEAEVAELAKIQEELKALYKRLKEIKEYLKSDTTGDKIGEEENNRLTAEANNILPQIKTLEAKKIALNKRKPVATPPAVASTSNPAMPPAPNQNQAGSSTVVTPWNPNSKEPIPILPPTPERKIINLKNQKNALTDQLNQLTDQEEEAIKNGQPQKAASISEKAAKLEKEIQGLVDEIAKTEQEKR